MMTLWKCLGVVMCFYALVKCILCVKRKQWEECTIYVGYAIVSASLIFSDVLLAELVEVAKYLGGPMMLGGGE